MQAITTTYKTDRTGNGYILVRCPALNRGKRISWDHGLDTIENHKAAATKIANELEWLEGYRLIFGSLANGDTVAVLTEDSNYCPDCDNIKLSCRNCGV